MGLLRNLCHRRQRLLAGLALFAVVLATFWPALQNDFVGYDDPEYVTANLHVQQGLSWQTLRWAFANTDVAAWHPLAWISHALDFQCFGLRPFGHHLTSVLFHAINAVLCFFVLRRLTGALIPSWAVAALFALHPLRVESVVWVSERKDVLSMTFFFLTLWAYARYVQSTGDPQTRMDNSPSPIQRRAVSFGTRLCHPGRKCFYGWALCFFALGLMSKPMLVTLPFVLLLLDAWPLRRISRETATRVIIEKLPFFAGALLVSLATIRAQPAAGAPANPLGWLARFENAPIAYCRYLGKLFWPAQLAPFYPPVEHWPAIARLGSLALLLALTGLALWQWRNRPYLLVGWVWFAGTLVPVIGLVRIGDQSVADRYSYLPSIGILLALAWAIGDLTAQWRLRRSVVGTCLGAILIACVELTRAQITYWKNSETLFRYTLSVTQGNYLAHNNLGVAFAQQGKWTEAIDQYQLALAIKPGYPEALENLGVALDHIGQLENAIGAFQQALSQRPDFVAARNSLGLAYEKQGRFDAALQQFDQAVRIKPDDADAHFNLALERERQGQLAQAATEFQRTLEIEPNSADAHNNLGVLQEKQGQLDAAIQSYQTALRINPQFARAHFNLGVALTKKGQIGAAISELQTALKLRPDYPAARTNLAILRSLIQP